MTSRYWFDTIKKKNLYYFNSIYTLLKCWLGQNMSYFINTNNKINKIFV